jgi:hypothetical protein
MNWLAALVMILFCQVACAENEVIKIIDQPKWKEECGSCHIAFPPQLLTGSDWQRVMLGLDKHFGSNAAIDPKDNQEILNFLIDNSGTAWGGKSSDSGLRITDTSWFNRKHKKVPNRIWFDAAVKSPSNCIACHVEAERGDWSAKSIHIPMPGSKGPAPESNMNNSDKPNKSAGAS